MAKLPKISIVSPSYNQGNFIESCIQSVLDQEYGNFEHIIMDGGSQDNTRAILKKYPHLIWISESDQGQSDALNKGFKLCTGKYIGWLNSDDRYLPGCFQAVADYFMHYTNADIVYGDYRWIDECNNVLKIKKETSFDLFILKYLHILYIPSTATFFKRRIFDEGNFLDISYQYAMDYEYFLRLALNFYRLSHMKHILADYRWHPGSKSSKMARQQKLERELALLQLDPFLRSVSAESIKKFVRFLLLIVARTKRTGKKIFEGCYW